MTSARYQDSIPINPIALRKAKIVCNFGLSECNRVNCSLYRDELESAATLVLKNVYQELQIVNMKLNIHFLECYESRDNLMLEILLF